MTWSGWLRSAMFAGLALLAGCATNKHAPPSTAPTVRFELVSWSKLPGWRADDTLAAWPAIIASCSAIHARAEWQQFCADVVAASPGDSEFARSFLEQRLQPYRVWRVTGRERSSKGLVTGYYEPLLHGSRERSEQFAT